MINIALIFLFVFNTWQFQDFKSKFAISGFFLYASPKLNAHLLSDIHHVIRIDKFDLNVHMQQQKQYVEQGNLITLMSKQLFGAGS